MEDFNRSSTCPSSNGLKGSSHEAGVPATWPPVHIGYTMPFFQGSQGVNIHGGDFHDIVPHHTTSVQDSSNLASRTSARLLQQWAFDVCANDNYFAHSPRSTTPAPSSKSESQGRDKKILQTQNLNDTVMSAPQPFVSGVANLESTPRQHPSEQPSPCFGVKRSMMDGKDQNSPWRMTATAPEYKRSRPRSPIQSDPAPPSSARLQSSDPPEGIVEAQQAQQPPLEQSPSIATSRSF
ncbi:hypothetical protein LshimejAT787_0704510 [Lyophyllum shimeji]|uniref:Uncharacterized protein n=1 Tax=Lyophyllum shimeji TaxID=47721 RepID=A0A9P3UR71_LYOSH|nr:hypothetical protein LshimejAT787_0704510 [Lyophyllum shimeji]